MEGLYYCHDQVVTCFLWFYRDGRVISGDNSTKVDQSSPQWFEAKPYKVHYSRGIYEIGKDNRIRIVIKGEDYGTLVYQGTIHNDDTIELTCRCPFTNHIKSAIYTRFTEGKHIIHMEISNFCIN
jgi:hypothetical protein